MKELKRYPGIILVTVVLLSISCFKEASVPVGVKGPVKITAESYPFNAADHSVVPQNLKKNNYIEEEYFVSGKANVYDYDSKGKVVVRTSDAPYTTRILIRRPADKSKFSGNVIVELNNPTAMYDMDLQWMFCRDFFIENNDIWVGITVKPIAIKALKKFNSERYASLSMSNPQPEDKRCKPEASGNNDSTHETENGLVWDIVSQVGILLKSKAKSNPIKDYDVKYLVATGYSQTGGYLTTYINLIHPLDTARLKDGSSIYDGFMIGDGDAFMSPLNQCVDRMPPGETSVKVKPCEVPVVSVVTQGLLSATMFARRPDSETPEDKFRRYEIPSAAHVNRISNDHKPCEADLEKAGIPAAGANCEGVNEYGVTDFPMEYFMNSAYQNLYVWMRTGTPSPKAEPIIMDGTMVRLDKHGNALGGVRNPYVEYPIATYYVQSNPVDQGSTFFCMIAGYKKPFSKAEIKSLYPAKSVYQKKVNTMVDQMVKKRFLTKTDGERIKKETRELKVW